MTSHPDAEHSVSSREMKMLYLATGVGAIFSSAFVNLTLGKLFSPPIGMAAGMGLLVLLLSVPHRLLQPREARPSVVRHLLAAATAAVVAGALTYAIQRWL
jgi:hypothetical protein